MGTNSKFMLHNKTILFLISLSQRTIQDIEDKGVGYQLFLQIVRSYSHVEIHEEISEELIGTASQYQVVTIVGHNINDCIELADGSLFPMRKIASALPPTFDGYLHVAVCGSSFIFDAIKECAPNSRVRTSEDFEELELDLLIYSELLSRSDLKKYTFDDYYGAYYNYIKEEQEHKKPADIAKFPRATKLGTMATGERPFEVPRNSEFFIRVIFHDESSEETIEKNIKNAYNISYQIKDSILEELKDGDIINVNLNFDCRYPEMKKYIIGGGEQPFAFSINKAKNEVSFRCFVEDGFRLNGFSGTVTVNIKEFPVYTWEFPIGVIPYIDEYTNDRSSYRSIDDHSDNLTDNTFRSSIRRVGTRRIDPTQIKPKKQKPKTNYKDFVQCVKIPQHAEAIIKQLHAYVDSIDKPKSIMMYIRAAMDSGAISKPTYGQFCEEFGNDKLKSKTSFNTYLDDSNKSFYHGETFESLKEEFKKWAKTN